jgi:arginyl-tRNA synthetase
MNLLTHLRSLFEPAVSALAPDPAKVPDLLGMVKPAANADHGDYQANMAMAMANRAAGQKPPEVAKAIVAALPANDALEPPPSPGPGSSTCDSRPTSSPPRCARSPPTRGWASRRWRSRRRS